MCTEYVWLSLVLAADRFSLKYTIILDCLAQQFLSNYVEAFCYGSSKVYCFSV